MQIEILVVPSNILVIKEGGKGYFGISGYAFLEVGISGLDPLYYGILGSENIWDPGFIVFVNGILGYDLRSFGILGYTFCPSLACLIFGIYVNFGITQFQSRDFGIETPSWPPSVMELFCIK